MCDPVTLTSLALSGAGTYLQAREANKNAKREMAAKNRAFQDHSDRQRAFADDASIEQNKNVESHSRDQFDEQKDVEADKVKRAFAEKRVQPDYNVGISASTPKNVVLARKAFSDDAAAETDRNVDALSNLSGYGGAMFQSGLDRSEFARLFGGIQDKAGADTRLLPIEMSAAANNARKSPSLFPTLLKLGGTGLGMYNAAGGFDPNLVGNQRIDGADFFNPGARKDISYSLRGGYGPYRY